MSDKFEGRTMTAGYTFITAGTAHTFTFPFQPDVVELINTTTWKATAAGTPKSYWFRTLTTAAHAFQEQVIDSSAGASFNFLDTAAAGSTSANTAGGPTAARASVAGISQADPCVVTTVASHGFQTGQIVRFTELGLVTTGTDHGMVQLNNNRYLIVVTAVNAFSLKDPITGLPIDSSAYQAWAAGGEILNETRVITLNNPSDGSYTPNPFTYDAVLYKLTIDTAVMGTDGDVYLMKAHKFGEFTDLGDLLT